MSYSETQKGVHYFIIIYIIYIVLGAIQSKQAHVLIFTNEKFMNFILFKLFSQF